MTDAKSRLCRADPPSNALNVASGCLTITMAAKLAKPHSDAWDEPVFKRCLIPQVISKHIFYTFHFSQYLIGCFSRLLLRDCAA
jgi:hypothetical protein